MRINVTSYNMDIYDEYIDRGLKNRWVKIILILVIPYKWWFQS